MDSLWSNLHNENNNLDKTDEEPLSWEFQMDPDPRILGQHLNVIKAYFEIGTPIDYESLKLIFTPQKLFEKHKGANLALKNLHKTCVKYVQL